MEEEEDDAFDWIEEGGGDDENTKLLKELVTNLDKHRIKNHPKRRRRRRETNDRDEECFEMGTFKEEKKESTRILFML